MNLRRGSLDRVLIELPALDRYLASSELIFVNNIQNRKLSSDTVDGTMEDVLSKWLIVEVVVLGRV